MRLILVLGCTLMLAPSCLSAQARKVWWAGVHYGRATGTTDGFSAGAAVVDYAMQVCADGTYINVAYRLRSGSAEGGPYYVYQGNASRVSRNGLEPSTLQTQVRVIFYSHEVINAQRSIGTRSDLESVCGFAAQYVSFPIPRDQQVKSEAERRALLDHVSIDFGVGQNPLVNADVEREVAAAFAEAAAAKRTADEASRREHTAAGDRALQAGNHGSRRVAASSGSAGASQPSPASQPSAGETARREAEAAATIERINEAQRQREADKARTAEKYEGVIDIAKDISAMRERSKQEKLEKEQRAEAAAERHEAAVTEAVAKLQPCEWVPNTVSIQFGASSIYSAGRIGFENGGFAAEECRSPDGRPAHLWQLHLAEGVSDGEVTLTSRQKPMRLRVMNPETGRVLAELHAGGAYASYDTARMVLPPGWYGLLVIDDAPGTSSLYSISAERNPISEARNTYGEPVDFGCANERALRATRPTDSSYTSLPIVNRTIADQQVFYLGQNAKGKDDKRMITLAPGASYVQTTRSNVFYMVTDNRKRCLSILGRWTALNFDPAINELVRESIDASWVTRHMATHSGEAPTIAVSKSHNAADGSSIAPLLERIADAFARTYVVQVKQSDSADYTIFADISKATSADTPELGARYSVDLRVLDASGTVVWNGRRAIQLQK